MSTPVELPAHTHSNYPPDLSLVARQAFTRLLQREHPGVSLEPDNTWLVFFEFKSTGIPPFTQFPAENKPETATPGVRHFLRSQILRDSLFDYFLGQDSFGTDTHFGLFRAAQSVADGDRVSELGHIQIVRLYEQFKVSLEQSYRQALADYWNVMEPGGQSRRQLFIAERKKALRLESRLGVERNLLTTTQHAMLEQALDHSQGNAAVQKHSVFHLALQEGQASPLVLCAAFVLVHSVSTELPSLKDMDLGEVLLHTANRGPEGFDSLAAMTRSLNLRIADPAHKHILLRNLADEHREKLLAADIRPHHWALTAFSGNILQTQFDLQVQRQQADFSHLLRQARASAVQAKTFHTALPEVLQRYAQFDNAFVLDRNDRLLVNSMTPGWWSASAEEDQQAWVGAAQNYGDAIIKLHLLSQSTTTEPAAVATRNSSWLKHAKRLMAAQMQMGLARASTEQLPATAQAWIKAVIDNPTASHRAMVDKQAIRLEFATLNRQPLPDVMRIGPALPGPDDPLLICTLNAPDNKVFRWFANPTAMREQFIDNALFTRYLLTQLPDEARPVTWHDVQYPLWLKHHHAPDAFSYLPQPRALPPFTFGALAFIEQVQDFMQASHDLKLALFDPPQVSASARIGSFLATAVVNIVPFFLPPPLLISLALGAALLKAWDGFHHVAEHDYQGAAREFLDAVGYLAAAAVGTYLLRRAPFTALENIRPAPPLVRRLGSDGQERIGYLLSPSSAPRLAELDTVLPYDANKFRAIKVDGQPYFVKPYANLFGHRQLYRQDLGDPSLLVSDGDYAVQGSAGTWRKIVYNSSRTRHWGYKAASRELAELTATWPTSVEQVTATEKSAYETDYLAMAKTSNTEYLPEVLDYCEGGSAAINSLLRSGQNTLQSRLFLAEFYRLHEYRSMAFRAVNVSLNGLQRLKSGVGLVFVDHGIQSASISRWGAQQWSRERFVTEHASAYTRAVFVIFDTTLPKKNLFTRFLGDHVAIAPSVPMQLMSVREVGTNVYLYVSRAMHLPRRMYDFYSGVEELVL